MSKIKLVHIISSLKVGGAESWLYDLVRSLDHNIFENHVIYFHSGPNVERINKLGIPTYQIRGLFFKYDPVFFIRLFLLVKKIKPDFMHSSLWAANIASRLIAKLLKIPNICVLHLVSNLESISKSSFFRNFLDRCTISMSDKLIAVSQSMVENFSENYKWIPATKLMVIENGIDVNFVAEQGFKEQKNREDFGLTKNNFVIGSVGRYIPRKRQEVLIETIALIIEKIPEIRLMLVGQGPLEDFLRKKAIDLKIQDKVIFTHASPAYGFYPLFDCFALPSDQEGLSIALLEAMSFGLPCIVVNNNAQHDVIISGINGHIIEKADKFELASIIELIYSNKELREKISKEAKSTVIKDFSLNSMINKYSKLFKLHT